ncbi:lipoyl(octanoyl) transferase LipB [Ferrimonas aestuarii]|uniref:Octanoyltransferase n=1 Tax=Ferrimonas aestuarii TaxID=2569539 RepID=A0A4U1BDP0_9GAMM|nr:lipoyl(octanoyl) transferase LipB [Ferrimonas aestuarii]TKB49109.1 lipoyl(octanoyl) transferase LipB [Ferrimonas aestuarii]
MVAKTLVVRRLGLQPYEPVWHAMQAFTDNRNDDSPDELWLLEHQPVFTQGQAGKAEHLLNTGDIPVVQVDRGGQVTFHGPGQLVAYPLLNIRRLGIGVRDLVTHIEQCLIELLAPYEIKAYAKADAPGVYVNERKVASLGLRIRKGCSFHGLALNVNMDTSPFLRINPCGYAGMEMVQSSDIGGPQRVEQAAEELTNIFYKKLGYTQITVLEGLPA